MSVDVGSPPQAHEPEHQVEKAAISRLELFVPGGYPAERLGLAEQPLDPVSLPHDKAQKVVAAMLKELCGRKVHDPAMEAVLEITSKSPWKIEHTSCGNAVVAGKRSVAT